MNPLRRTLFILGALLTEKLSPRSAKISVDLHIVNGINHENTD